MKMFVYSLEGDARQWYRSLPISSISSLKDFHVAFHSYCKRIYPAERLFEHCCEGYALYTQNFVDYSSSSADEGDDNIEEEEEDSLSAISSSNSVLQQEDFQQSDIEIDNNDTLDAFGINPNVSNSSDYDTKVVPNLFEGYIVDDNTHKSSSLSLELYHIAPVYDEYTDDEKELNVYETFEGSLANKTLSSSDFQQTYDQQYIHVTVDDSYEFLFKIPMKISLFLINLTKISLLRRIINRSLMIYLSKLILHLITMETVMLKIMNILLYFPLKYVDVMGQQMTVVDSSHRNIVREIK
jgi:hypothetical protein